MKIKGLDKLKGLLPARFRTKAAPSITQLPEPPQELQVPLLTLSAAVGPLMDEKGLSRDSRIDIAKAWHSLGQHMNKMGEFSPAHSDHNYKMLRHHVQSIAKAIATEKENQHITIRTSTLREMVQFTTNLSRMVDYLCETPINVKELSPNICVWPGAKYLAMNYPEYSEHGALARTMDATCTAMTNYITNFYAQAMNGYRISMQAPNQTSSAPQARAEL